MQTICYHHKDFSLLWKPHGVPSTFGKQESFLDLFTTKEAEWCLVTTPLSTLLPADLQSLTTSRLQERTEDRDLQAFLDSQVDRFGQAQEYGLLNRLDNDTAGFLYFARTQEAYDQFKTLQKSNAIQKFYFTQIQGQYTGPELITWPIMHHSSDPERMVVIKTPQDMRHTRGKIHETETRVQILHYDESTQLSTLLVTITRGIRHQIRVHLASEGYPIVGDILYGTGGDQLHLRSMGFSSEEIGQKK